MGIETIRTVGVVGAGQMGSGIAHVFAEAGFEVLLHDITAQLVERGVATIDRNLQRGVDKGKLTPDAKREVLARVRGVDDIDALAGAQFVAGLQAGVRGQRGPGVLPVTAIFHHALDAGDRRGGSARRQV